MTLKLSNDTERLIENQLRSGKYHSPDELVAAALVALDVGDRRLDTAEQLNRFQKKIAAGLAQAQAGQFVDGEAVFEKLDQDDDHG